MLCHSIALFVHLTTELSFRDADAERAVRALDVFGLAGFGASDEDGEINENEAIHTISAKKDPNELDSDQLGLAMDWLCLHLDENELKTGFKPNPIAKEKFGKRLKKNGALLPGTGATRPIAHDSISIAPPLRGDKFKEATRHSSRIIGFVRIGFNHSEAEKACDMTTAPSSPVTEDDTEAIRILLSFLEREIGIRRSSPLSSDRPKPNAEDLVFAAEERSQEIEALEAIYDENFTVLDKDGKEGGGADSECRMKILIDPMDALKSPLKIEGSKLHVFSRATYPILSPPLMLFTNPTLAPSLLRRINEAIIRKADEMEGQPVVFEIMEFIADQVPVLHEDFAKEQRKKEMEAEQLRLRKAAGHNVEDAIDAQYESGGKIGRRQRAKLKAAEKAFDRDDKDGAEAIEKEKVQKERLERIKHEDQNQRFLHGERALLLRERERIAQEAESASRSAMNSAFLRGESVDEARDAALQAKIESLRANGEDVSQLEAESLRRRKEIAAPVAAKKEDAGPGSSSVESTQDVNGDVKVQLPTEEDDEDRDDDQKSEETYFSLNQLSQPNDDIAVLTDFDVPPLPLPVPPPAPPRW